MKAFRHILQFWPIGILLFLEGTLVGANYKPGTWLMGWDNVMPEFNFRQALVTNIFGVWQEHRGLGLYDGMGHAANLVHTIFLWILSLALPINLLRYIFHFLMHLLGGVGVYVLIAHLRGANFFHLGGEKRIDNNNAVALSLSITRWVALAGALFYQYNLATIQMFYTPLEAFSVHFAALPWLAWSLIHYLQEGSRKKLLMFLFVSLLSTPQFFIPTLLLPIGILLGSTTLFPFTQESVLHTQDTLLKKSITAMVGFLLINAFWILPYLYGLPHNAPIIQAAKINQMSSGEVFARNQAFGGLGDVLRLRGFPLDFEDIATDGTTTFLMAPWRAFLDQPLVATASWLLVGIVLIGIVSLARHSLARLGMFPLTFFVAFIFLANDTPVIREITTAIRDAAPMLSEAYRFPFTKFSLLFGLSSAILFSVGLSKITRNRGAIGAVILLVLLLTTPSFGGHFFSDRLRILLPDDYQRIFSFMKEQPIGRIAYLPQHQYWSWKYYRWGYRGSGFVWYGLSQPIMDRAFDPWSNENENYYWELSRSIYSKDVAAFDAVLNKYDVRYVLLDENIISPSHNRALFTEEIKAMLASLPEIRETARFGKLTVYERWIPDRVGDDVTVKTDLPLVSPSYRWTDNDVAYRELGDYEIASPSERSRNDVVLYPFRSLFTKRSVDEREFDVDENEDTVTVRSLLFNGSGLVIPKEKVREKQNGDQKNRIDDTGIQIKINEIDFSQVNHSLPPRNVFVSKYNDHQYDDNSQQAVSNDNLHEVRRIDHIRLSNQIAANNDAIPNTVFTVSTIDQSPRPEKTVGNMTNDPTQPADKLVNNPDNTRVTDRDFSTDITTNVSGNTYRVNVSVPKVDALVYDSTKSADLVAKNVKPCGVARDGTTTAENFSDTTSDVRTSFTSEVKNTPFLRFRSRNQRGCLSFGATDLPHRDGYLVAVESRHVTGRPMLFSLINQTAKHVELETYLPTQPQKVKPFRHDYFILPPLASDGLGYTVYLSNDAIGRQETINDIKSIKFYRIPYQELVTMSSRLLRRYAPRNDNTIEVDHPNPAYYLAKLDPAPQGNQTLILSQSFNPGWTAWEKIPTFPYLRQLKDHVLVNNWSNGWSLPNNQVTNNESTIILFFLPQLLQWLGFLLLPIPFLIVYLKKI